MQQTYAGSEPWGQGSTQDRAVLALEAELAMLGVQCAAQRQALDAARAAAPEGSALRARIAELEAELNGILQSTTWRTTAALRSGLDGRPELRRLIRRALKLGWWTLTLQLPSRYAEWRLRRSQPQPAAAPLAIPPAPRNTVDPAAACAIAAHWYDDTAPKVSIIVLNYNGAALTQACLESIWAHTTDVR